MGVSGGDRDEWGKLGREDRKTGTGGGKVAGVSHGICFCFQYRLFFRFQYRISLNLFIFHRTLQAARGVGVSGGGGGDERGKLGWGDNLTSTVGVARVIYSAASFVFIFVFCISISFSIIKCDR